MIKRLILRYSWLLQLANWINKKRSQRRLNLKLGKSVFLGFSSVLEGYNFINNNTSIVNCYMGFGSYVANDSKISNTKIGKYSSIGPRVHCVFGKHPTHTFVSSHPSFFSIRKQVGFSFTKTQLFEEFAKPRDEAGKYSILIGNDVWIGAGVSILDGVSIGNGAIVATHALVVKDVMPYSIVGGVPAKHIKYRFTESQINFLQQFCWWDRSQEWIANNAHLFTDIENFIEHQKDLNDE